MRKIKVGDKLQVHCYKHDGTLYRVCDEALVLDIKDDFIVCGNYRTKIIEKDNIRKKTFHSYQTNEPAILFFYDNRWFNIIGQFKETGIYYYCNIATPYIIDDGLIKYIDYDLDLRIFPDGSFNVLDKNEYKYHKKKFGYSEDLNKVINYELSNLIELSKNNKGPFDKKMLKKYNKQYLDVILKDK